MCIEKPVDWGDPGEAKDSFPRCWQKWSQGIMLAYPISFYSLSHCLLWPAYTDGTLTNVRETEAWACTWVRALCLAALGSHLPGKESKLAWRHPAQPTESISAWEKPFQIIQPQTVATRWLQLHSLSLTNLLTHRIMSHQNGGWCQLLYSVVVCYAMKDHQYKGTQGNYPSKTHETGLQLG